VLRAVPQVEVDCHVARQQTELVVGGDVRDPLAAVVDLAAV
jgi:hypothetical protein